MARFFEGGKQGIAKSVQNANPKNRAGNLVKNIGKGTAKQVNRETIAKQAQKQYSTGTPSRDANIVKAVSEALDSFTGYNNQQTNRGLNRSSVKNAGAFNYTFKPQNKTAMSGQYGGAGSQARQALESIVPKPGDWVASAKFAAQRDTSKNLEDMSFYDKYSFPQEAHDKIIEQGNLWMTDENALTEWITGGIDFGSGLATEADVEAARKRQEQYEAYMDKYLKGVTTFNPETNMARIEQQFVADAPLPPWIPPTAMNYRMWEYYTNYSHDVVQSAADSFTAYSKEKEEFAKNPYKSAFSSEHDSGDVDSFLDIIISSIDTSSISNTYKNFTENTAAYFTDYVVNPIKAGKFLTAAGNSLWNLMDSMDFAARGVRAFVAGDSALGGVHGYETKTKTALSGVGYSFLGEPLEATEEHEFSKRNDAAFKGQEVYWVHLDGKSDEEAQRLQEKFMRNGGYALLLKARPGDASKADLGADDMGLSVEELEAKLDAAFYESDVNWRDIYDDINTNYYASDRALQDLDNAMQNVKAAYSEPAASFNADTGSMGADMLIETALDPGLIFGGLSKNLVKGNMRSASELAVRDGLIQVLKNSDDAKALMKNKRVNAAISTFINSNEGRNIIFKDSKKFSEDVSLLMRTLERDVPNIFGDKSTQEALSLYKANKKAFADTVSAHLFSKNQKINTDIIASTGFARNMIDNKTFKAAYYMDKAIDGVDSMIIKSSFMAPWALVKGAKRGKSIIMGSEAVRKMHVRKQLDLAEAARTVVDSKSGNIDVTSISSLTAKRNQGIISEQGARYALQHIVDAYDSVAYDINTTLSKFVREEITDEEALELVSEMISSATGGKYNSIDALASYVSTIEVRYAYDAQAAFNRLDKAYKRLTDVINRRSDAAVSDFLDSLRDANSVEDVRRIFRENMDLVNNSFTEHVEQFQKAEPVINYVFKLRDDVFNSVAKLDLSLEDIDNLAEELRTGMFTSLDLERKEVNQAIKAVKKVSSQTVERTISFDTMDELIKDVGIDLNKKEYEKLTRLMVEWVENKNVMYNVEDILYYIDRFQRSVQFKQFLNNAVPTEAATLASQKFLAEVQALRAAVKKLDVISLKDARVITTLHVDRMALFQQFRNDSRIQKLYGEYYDKVLAPIVSDVKKMLSDDVDLAHTSIAQDILELSEMKYGFDRTSALIDEIKAMRGIRDDKLYIILNGLSNNFGMYGNLQNLTASPERLRNALEVSLRSLTGESKLSMPALTDMLKTAGTDHASKFLQDYAEEFKDPEIVQAFSKIVDGNVMDPGSFVEKQMLATVLMDPSCIDEYNALARRGQAPIFFHESTTGLNSEINSLTAVSVRKWVPIEYSEEDPLTLKKILDAFSQEETITFKRGMTDDEIESISENVLRRIDMKCCSTSDILSNYKAFFGVTAGNKLKSEEELIEEVCDYLNTNSISSDLQTVVPSLIVHDSNGFNLSFFNRKVGMLTNIEEGSKTYDYATRIMRDIDRNQINTYDRLSNKIGDFAFTDEEIDHVTELLYDYAEDINKYANEDFRFMDFRAYGNKLERMIDRCVLRSQANEWNALDSELLARLRFAKPKEGERDALLEFKDAIQEITDITLHPRQFVFMSSGLEDNFAKTAFEATGRTSINVESRIYVDDVMSYFDIADSDGFSVPMEDLQKMHKLSRYIINKRDKELVAGAEEFLLQYKPRFDQIIETVIQMSRRSSWTSTELAYLQHIKVPNTAAESFLMCQKLYNDHLKYWLNIDNVASFKRTGRDIDAMKVALEQLGKGVGKQTIYYDLTKAETMDMIADYANNFRRRFAAELFTGDGFNPEYETVFNKAYLESGLDTFWKDYSDEAKNLWNEMKSSNKSDWESYNEIKKLKSTISDELRSEFNPKYEELSKEWDAYREAKEYRSYIYSDVKERTAKKWDIYRSKNKEAKELYKAIKRDIKDPRWDEYKRLRKELKDLKSEINADWEEYKAADAVYKTFDKEQLDSKTSALKERYEAAKAGELPSESSDALKRIVDSKDYSEELKEAILHGKTHDVYLNVKDITEARYSEVREMSDIRYQKAIEQYEELAYSSKNSFYNALDKSEYFLGDQDNYLAPVLNMLEGAHASEIYKSAARSDYSKQIYKVKNGTLRQGIDKAVQLSEANSNIKSNLRQLDYIDQYYASSGIRTTVDRYTALVHMKAKQLFDILDGSGFAKRESFHDFINRASAAYHMRFQQYRLDSLRVNGAFNRGKLLSELAYNGFNSTVFNTHLYTLDEMHELRDFVKKLQASGDDFISYYEDRSTGNITIYLNNKCQVGTDGSNRFINHEPVEALVRDAVAYPEFDELVKKIDDIEDIEDFRGVYEHLLSCWEDTKILSQGKINGTSGRTVSRRQAEEFLASLPSNVNDMLSPEGLLRADIARDVVYDPGFVINENSDMLLDFLHTLDRQAEVAKEDCVIINEVFNKNGSLQFNELAQHFTDKELITYFGNNPNYVVATITEGKGTRTGLQIRQLRLDNKASLEAAKKLPNTTILPYDMYFELADYMNKAPSDSIYKRMLGKYLLAYKAFALAKPGTWMRNYIDATTKAALDVDEGLGGLADLVQYQGKAARDLGTYSKLMKTDPKLLTKSNWSLIQSTLDTDMTYEDFELLRGIMDSTRFTSADKYFIKETALKRGGLDIISGENIGIRNLEESDISKAFDKYLASESELPLSKKEFLDIYLNNVSVTDEVLEQYEDMMRTLSTNLHSADVSSMFDKTIQNVFKPFGAVEHLVRYAQTLQLIDRGLTQNQITRRIHATQFYNAPSWGAWNKLETIMPFITFKYNNMMYWMRMMDENPRFFRYFEDIYGTISEDTIENMVDSDQDIDYETDFALQSGGVPLGDTGYYLNLNSSFLAAVNDYYGISKQIDSLNPLLETSLKFSLYGLGLNSKAFFSEVDLNMGEADMNKIAFNMLPGASLISSGRRMFKNIAGTSDENGGPTIDTLFATLNGLGVLGMRKTFSSGGSYDFQEWQAELEKQGKWFDANTGKILDISQKNEYGANDPNISWEDRQAYMLIHFDKVWDPNQHKFVNKNELVDGNLDIKFDFENDPEAWDKLQKWMRLKGKIYDYNQKKFVRPEDYISGGLNDPDITFEQKAQLMDEKFGLVWDGNQNTWVTRDKYIEGGLNATENFNEVKSLRLALYGEVYQYDPEKGKKAFVKVQEPSIVTIGDFFKNEEYDEYFSRLAIPRLQNVDMKFHVNSEGLLVTEDGKYILTNNPEYNAQVFNKFKNTFSGRSYRGHKKKTFNAFYKTNKKPYKGRPVYNHFYTGYGWNDKDGYYRWNFQYNYQYHSPQPGRNLHRLLSPRINYPYGGGYNKYSFHSR